jgi:hypothetical protein
MAATAKTPEELKKESAALVRAERDVRLDRKAREKRDGLILGAFDRMAQAAEQTIDIVVTRTLGGTVFARRLRTEADVRAGRIYPEIRWADLEELDDRPRVGEVISISVSDYEDCEVAQ